MCVFFFSSSRRHTSLVHDWSSDVCSTDLDGLWIQKTELHFKMNESDNYALEEALQIREQKGTDEVVIVSLGPDRCQKVIREALAKIGRASGRERV